MNPRHVVLALLVVAVALVGAVALQRQLGDGPASDRPAGSVAAAPPVRAEPAVGLLHRWDARRADAFARGDLRALGRLYVPRSRAARADRRILAAYVGRGLRVRGLRTQVLEAAVVRSGATRLVLDVTDRVAAGTVVGRGVRRPLPTDNPTRRRIVLVRLGEGGWRVAAVSGR